MGGALDGRTAIVTGGSKGIGKAIAAALAAEGASVMITSRKADACAAAAAEIGNGCAWEAGNVGNPEDAARVVDAAIARFGAVDVLVNNAATNPYAGPLVGVDLPRWEKTLQVNLTAPLVWTQLCWTRSMHEREGCSVVNISSVGALGTNPILGAYDVSKAALLHLTQQLAVELAPRVRVNAICPGLIRTDFARALWEGEGGDRVAASYPLGRLGEPEDVAAAARYLVVDAPWMTGQTLVLDGGGTVAFSRF
jgi:NAD(P)-dependent dehydrogenase (short-subunit alcohol dehydrogenase family)